MDETSGTIKDEATQGNWVDIREPHTDKLLCRHDPTRNLLEFQRRGHRTIVDLNTDGQGIIEQFIKVWQPIVEELAGLIDE